MRWHPTRLSWLIAWGVSGLAAAVLAQDPPGPVPAPDPAPATAPAQDAPADDGAARRALLERALDTLKGPEIHAHIQILAHDDFNGREAGTQDGRRAADYVAGRFRAAGLEPFGEEGSFFQAFRIDGRLAHAPACAASIVSGDRERGWVPEVDFLPFTRAPVPEAFGALVFVGYGISATDLGYDDYAGCDVKGKLVLMLRYTPREKEAESRFPGSAALRHGDLRRKVRLAHEHGAVGLLLVTGPAGHPDDGDRLDVAPFDAPIPAIQVARSALEPALRAAGVDLGALQQKVDASGAPASQALPARARILAAMRTINDLTHNVLGVLRGRDPALAEECVVLGGHYDHVGLGHFGSRIPGSTGQIHNGADDNASGISGVIAIAEALHAAGCVPRRSILFMGFGAEEKGLLGSRHYVNHPRWPIGKTIAMINLDMIGRGADNWCSANGVGTSPGFRPMVERLNEKVGLDLEYSEGGTAPSDNTWFYRKDMPVLFFFTGLHPEYHAPTDDADLIEVETLARVTRLSLLCTYVLAEAETRPEFRRHDLSPIPRLNFPNPFADRGYVGWVAKAVVDGAVELGVVEGGSPAELAGLRAGDRVRRVGRQAVTSLEAFLDVTTKLTGGRRVTVEVVREGRTLSVDVLVAPPPPKGTIGCAVAPSADRTGVVIAQVEEGSPAAEAGVRAGDRVLALDHQPVRDVPGFQDASARLVAGRRIQLDLRREGQTLTLEMVPVPRAR